MNTYELFAIVGIAILFDVVTGFTQAFYNKDVSSAKMRSGVYHKLSYVFAIALAYFLEYASQYIDIGYSIPVLIPTVIYIVLTELVSIVENIKKLNPELQKMPLFDKMNQKESEDNK